MRTVRNFARLLIAPVFIFSGFVKAIDPLGSAYKFSDYFEAFGLDFMMPISFGLAILLSTAELVIGLSLLMGIVMRVTSWALMVFMSFFTVLTLIIAFYNPVTDCGCFGDALILTNWQTFWKNIVFMLPTLFVFFNRRRFRSLTSENVEWGIALLFVLISVGISVTAYTNLPFADFRPYKMGTHIPSAMEIPEGAPIDEIEAIFIYEKDGVQQNFSAENIPYQDTAWKYFDRETRLIKKGYEPPIHDFSISTLDGEEITDSVLSDPAYSFLVVNYKLEKANAKGLNKVNEFFANLNTENVRIYGMTASTNSAIDESKSKFEFQYPYHVTDEITLKTMVRSNPGVLLLKEGTIIGKWHYNNLPEVSKVDANYLSLAIGAEQAKKSMWIYGFFFFVLLATVMFLLVLIQKE